MRACLAAIAAAASAFATAAGALATEGGASSGRQPAPEQPDDGWGSGRPSKLGRSEAPPSWDEEKPAPTQPRITPPVPRMTSVGYPPGASGDATVVLELSVDADGTVKESRIIRGEEPFAAAAKQASRQWRFDPAMRNGEPAAARIRYEVRFVEETQPVTEEEDEAEADAPRAEPAAAPPSAVPGAHGVLVRGARRAPGSVSVSRAEATQLPGAFGDPFRAIESLPGVTPIVSGIPFFFVRGAPPGNLGFFIDGVRVPLLYHAFLGPSVIHSAMLESIELHRGAYPARYGRFAGGVVSAETRRPDPEPRGEASLRLVDAAAYVSAPFADQRGHAAVSGRYSYTGLVLSLMTDAQLDYWDYQTLVSYDLSPRDTIGVFAFGAYDFLGQEGGEDFAGTEFHRVDLRYDRRFSDRTDARVAVTAGEDRSRASNGVLQDRMIAGRAEIRHRFGDGGALRVGGDVMFDRYSLTLDHAFGEFTSFEALFPSRDDMVVGGYVDVVLRPTSWITLAPGVRADFFRSGEATAMAVDPRLSALFEVNDDVRLIHTIGLAHQTPNFVPNLPGARVGGLRGGLQRSLQTSAGVETDLPADLTASAVLFQNAFFNLTDPLGFSRQLSFDVDVADIRALGSAVGLEVFVKRSLTRRLGGYVSYTLSRSVRSRGRLESLSAFDRTHVGMVAAAYDLGRRWRLGARAAYVSGVPTRELTVDGPRFHADERGPAFVRLDLRLSKRWQLTERAYWGVVAEVLNATAAQEVVGRSCNPIRCDESRVGPLVLPSLGLEGGF